VPDPPINNAFIAILLFEEYIITKEKKRGKIYHGLSSLQQAQHFHKEQCKQRAGIKEGRDEFLTPNCQSDNR
jgi:hypothetical protein